MFYVTYISLRYASVLSTCTSFLLTRTIMEYVLNVIRGTYGGPKNVFIKLVYLAS